MTPDDRANALARTREARRRLFATLGEVQERLRPASIAQGAVESAAQGVASAARRGAEAVRARPLAVAAVAGTIGLVMARGWIADIIGNHRLKGQDAGGDARDLNGKRARRARKGRTT